jgi:hypothetical protein
MCLKRHKGDDTMFKFNTISEKELSIFSDSAYVFNMPLDEIKKIQIVENKFTTEDMGESAESVDIFVDTVDKGLLVISDYLDKDNFFVSEAGSGSGVYALGGMLDLLETKEVAFRGILVVVRTASNFILDRKKLNSSASYYSICPNEVRDVLEKVPALDGWLAKNKVRLTNNFREEINNELNLALGMGNLSDYTYQLYKDALNEIQIF